MFGISGLELLIIAAFVLIIFGPDKLPELARTAGRAMRMFKSAQEDMERVIKGEMLTPSASPTTSATPAAAKTPAKPAAPSTSAWATEEDEEEEDEE